MRLGILALALGVLVAALPAAAGAKPGGQTGQEAQKAGPKVTVMTRNVQVDWGGRPFPERIHLPGLNFCCAQPSTPNA